MTFVPKAHSRKRLVVKQRRYECVYKRIADLNVTFCEKGGTVKQVTDFLHKKIGTSVTCSDVVGRDGFEPSKLQATDLQSAPFGHSGTCPLELVMGLEPATC